MVPNGTEYADYPIFAGSGTKVKPSPDSKYAQGFLPGETFPAEWSNYLFYGATGGITRLNADTNSIKKELNSILTAYGIANNADAFNQLLTALNRIYPQICECTTAAGTEVKSVAITGDGVILKAGNVYAITMTNGNTYGNGTTTYPKLSINSSTARPLCDANGNYLKAGAWAAGDVITVLYTGTKFLMATRAVTDAITEGDKSPVTSNALYQAIQALKQAVELPVGTWMAFENDTAPSDTWVQAETTFNPTDYPLLSTLLGGNTVPSRFDHSRPSAPIVKTSADGASAFPIGSANAVTAPYDALITISVYDEEESAESGVSVYVNDEKIAENSIFGSNNNAGVRTVTFNVKKSDSYYFVISNRASINTSRNNYYTVVNYTHPLFIKAK